MADLLSAQQKKLEILAIFLLFCTVGVRFKEKNAQWFWTGYSWIAMAIELVILVIAIVWVRIEKQKTAGLIAEIRKETQQQPFPLEALSVRQREVFDLIVEGKSNKAIMDILSIELSTLKTHIKQNLQNARHSFATGNPRIQAGKLNFFLSANLFSTLFQPCSTRSDQCLPLILLHQF